MACNFLRKRISNFNTHKISIISKNQRMVMRGNLFNIPSHDIPSFTKITKSGRSTFSKTSVSLLYVASVPLSCFHFRNIPYFVLLSSSSK